jgi:hypothetical protein
LIAFTLSTVFTIAFFNVLGVSITKFASAAQRSTVDTCRTLFVWIFMMGMGRESFNPVQLLGFVILVSGTLVYNEIVIMPCTALNQHTKEIL